MSISQGIVDGIPQIILKINSCLLLEKPLFVFIAGGSCSGKTTLTKEIKSRLPQTSVMSMDDYFLDFDDPDLPRENGRISFDSPGSYHWFEMIEHLKKLNQNESVLATVYNLTDNQRTKEKKEIFASDIVIIDGLFSINLGKEIDLNKITIFVDTPLRTRLKRRVFRDKGLASENIIIHHFLCYIEPLYQKFVFPQLEFADLVIKNE